MATFNENGFIPETLTSVMEGLLEEYQAIFGINTTFESNTPQGQFFNILAQAKLDIEDLLQFIYSQRNPDEATGKGLDAICAYNGIYRKGATYSQVNVEITVDREVTLQGIDSNSPYKVQDESGNEFGLVSTALLQPGTHKLLFQASSLGQITVLPNTITNPITVILGATNINNTEGTLTIGEDEETDAQLRIRRAISTSIASSSFVDSIYSNIANIDGVIATKVFSNNSNTSDAQRDIPAHNVWVIVDGGVDRNIAEAIYKLKPVGVPMKGDVLQTFTTKSGERQIIKFDRPIVQSIHLRFNIKTTEGNTSFDVNTIKDYIAKNFSVSIAESVYDSDMVTLTGNAINAVSGSGKVTDLQISSDGNTWVQSLDATSLQHKFTINTNNIVITNS